MEARKGDWKKTIVRVITQCGGREKEREKNGEGRKGGSRSKRRTSRSSS